MRFNLKRTQLFKEYLKDLLIKDLTTEEQNLVGITVLHIIAIKDIDFPLHKHRYFNQTLSVLGGEVQDIKDIDNIIRFGKGEVFFIPKGNNHQLRYTAGSELVLVYIPGLTNRKI